MWLGWAAAKEHPRNGTEQTQILLRISLSVNIWANICGTKATLRESRPLGSVSAIEKLICEKNRPLGRRRRMVLEDLKHPASLSTLCLSSSCDVEVLADGALVFDSGTGKYLPLF